MTSFAKQNRAYFALRDAKAAGRRAQLERADAEGRLFVCPCGYQTEVDYIRDACPACGASHPITAQPAS